MAETTEKPKRTVEEVQREYNQGCLRAGHMQYQIAVLSKDLNILNDALRDLNFEAATIQAKNNEEAAKAAAAAPPAGETPQLPKLEGLNNG